MLKRLINKLKRRKSDSIMKTTRKLIKFKAKRKVNPFLENNTNIRPAKKEAKLIQSLKQNLRKRVMEYKTMNNINVSIKDSSYRAPIDFNSKPKGRFIPVSKPINNCPSTKLPWTCKKLSDLALPYVYWTKSYKWLANAFSRNSLSEFKITEWSELTQLIKAFNKWSEIKVNKNEEDQISKDIVRTFPNNIFFNKNNSGYYSMFKVLSAYSNLEELMAKQNMKLKKSSSDARSRDSSTTESGNSRKIHSGNASKASLMRNELLESFWDLNFEDSTQYVQGMNFIVGILWYHLSPELAFWLFVKLMKDYDLEDNYTPGLHGFKMKSEILNEQIKRHLPKLFNFFVSAYG
jgi:hypothetical protein